MSSSFGPLRPLLRVGLPVAVAALLVGLAVLNIALVKTFRAEPEDGVLWRQSGADVIAVEVAPLAAGARAGIEPGDALRSIDGRDIHRVAEALAAVHGKPEGRGLSYVVRRGSTDQSLTVSPQA